MRFIAVSFFLFSALIAQNRIIGPLDQKSTVALKGHIHPSAQRQNDQGPVDPSMQLGEITLLMKPSPSQQSALDRLLVEQQYPSSSNFHRWLSPEQFADRFGLSLSDIAKT